MKVISKSMNSFFIESYCIQRVITSTTYIYALE